MTPWEEQIQFADQFARMRRDGSFTRVIRTNKETAMRSEGQQYIMVHRGMGYSGGAPITAGPFYTLLALVAFAEKSGIEEFEVRKLVQPLGA